MIRDFLLLFAAAFGTLAFDVIYGVPSKYYLQSVLVGVLGMLTYVLLTLVHAQPEVAIFFGTLVVAMSARFCAVWYSCPTTVFITTGLFPLIPGGGIYESIYYLVTGQTDKAGSAGTLAFKSVLAIVIAIVLVLELPNSIFKPKQKG